MKILDLYRDGQEAIGVDVGSFIPWLNIVSSVAGGASGMLGGKSPTTAPFAPATSATPAATGTSATPATPASAVTKADVATQVKKAVDAERRKQAQQKAESDIKKMQVALIAMGIGGAGIAVWALLRK